MLLSAAGIAFSTSPIAASIGCVAFGIASGAAMIPYTIVKEVNPDEVKGSATGAINFLTFGVTALVGPIFADLFGRVSQARQTMPRIFAKADCFGCSASYSRSC